MIRKGLRPDFTIGMELPGGQDDSRLVLPFRRSWVAIGILVVMDLIFLFPAVTTFQQAIVEWSQFDSLFDLVGVLFISAWLLGCTAAWGSWKGPAIPFEPRLALQPQVASESAINYDAVH